MCVRYSIDRYVREVGASLRRSMTRFLYLLSFFSFSFLFAHPPPTIFTPIILNQHNKYVLPLDMAPPQLLLETLASIPTSMYVPAVVVTTATSIAWGAWVSAKAKD